MYITLTKKRLFLLLCTVVAVLLVITQVFSVKAERIELSGNGERVEYIEGLGVELLNDEYTSKTITIPQEFGSVYAKYNLLQKTANFDLTDYKGKQVTIYTYTCVDEQVVNLLLYKGRLIGGDIAETRLNGSMNALKGDIKGYGTIG